MQPIIFKPAPPRTKMANGQSCPIDLKGVCETFYNIKISGENRGTGYRLGGFGYDGTEGKGNNLVFHFSDFRTDRYPGLGDLASALTAYLNTKDGQRDFCHSYILPRIESLYTRTGLPFEFKFTKDDMQAIGSRFNGLKVRENKLVPINAITSPSIRGFIIWLKNWYVIAHELMHVGSGLDFFPGNTFIGKAKCIITRVAGYLRGIGKSSPIGRYYGSRLWALWSNPANVLEETMTSAANTETDPDFEGLWKFVKNALLKLDVDGRREMLDGLVRAWLNLASAELNSRCQDFVMDAIRDGKKTD